MLYIFKNSLDDTLIVSEREARELLNNKSGGRIKYDYVGASDDTEYKVKKLKAIDEAQTKYPVRNQLDDEMILAKRKYLDEKIEKLDKDLISKADPTKRPREFKVFGINMSDSENKEELNPVFRGMIK